MSVSAITRILRLAALPMACASVFAQRGVCKLARESNRVASSIDPWAEAGVAVPCAAGVHQRFMGLAGAHHRRLCTGQWLAIAAQPQRPSHQRAPCGSHVSWRSVRDAYDNALAESHFARPEIEQVHHRVWKNVAPARLARRLVLAGQPRRRRSGVRPIQPVNFEKSLQAGQGQAFAFGVDGRGVRSHQGGCRRLTAKSAHGAVCTAQAI